MDILQEAYYILDEKLNDIEIQTEIGAMVALTAASVGISALSMAAKAYKNYMTKAGKACSGLPDKEKTLCMLKFQLGATNKQIETLKGSLGKCKNDQKCVTKINNKLSGLVNKAKFIKNRYRKLYAVPK